MGERCPIDVVDETDEAPKLYTVAGSIADALEGHGAGATPAGDQRSSSDDHTSTSLTRRVTGPRFSGRIASTSSTPVAEGALIAWTPRSCAASPISWVNE